MTLPVIRIPNARVQEGKSSLALESCVSFSLGSSSAGGDWKVASRRHSLAGYGRYTTVITLLLVMMKIMKVILIKLIKMQLLMLLLSLLKKTTTKNDEYHMSGTIDINTSTVDDCKRRPCMVIPMLMALVIIMISEINTAPHKQRDEVNIYDSAI